MRTPLSVLEEYWGYREFRPLQLDIIESVLHRKDTLAIMPTGGGKSICYQVPGMVMEGLCLVISPLIALMKDQVETLRKKGITAYAIYSGMTRSDVINTLKVATQSNCKFLYVSPERLETSLFKEYLPGLNIQLVAVDESHCISQWGYDFRPPYLRIASLRDELENVPVLALTASATPEVQDDICAKLAFRDANIFRQSFERPNLSYSVFKVDSKINKLIDILKGVPGSGLVYCKSRKRTQEIADLLKMHGMSADFYHAGLSQEERNARQESWINNSVSIIACTNAFGMGIDKPDVRVVVHVDTPDSLENYYQEAGRAGRDKKKAYAVLLYNEKDITEIEKLVQSRFPSVETMREVYQGVCNYLQVPSGAAEGNSFDFDLNDFIKKFNLDSFITIYSLKALEQEGWISFNDQVFVPSKVEFTTNRNAIQEFERQYPEHEELIKTMLRMYEGIFDFAISISEKQLGYVLKKSESEIKLNLSFLHSNGLIRYIPQKDRPQVFFLRERIKVEDLSIDYAAYNKRKEGFVARTNQMISFIENSVVCRSRMIGNYFGDANIGDCGVCDICLGKKTGPINKAEFDRINHIIIEAVRENPLHTKDLLEKLRGIRKEKAWSVIDHLQAENKIEMDGEGLIRLKG